MTKIHLPFVQKFGRYCYFRRRGLPRIRLPGIVGSAEFMDAYAQAIAAAPLPIGAGKRSKPGSVSEAVAGTPRKRRALLEGFREDHGHRQLATLPREFIVALLDTMPPFQARNWLTAFRHFAGWAVERKLLKTDPSLGIKLKAPKSDGHHSWSDAEIAAYEARHPIGSKARLALALGLYTAQRRSDVVCFGKQNIKNGVLTFRQKKTGTTLAIPVHAELAKIIAASATGDLTLLVTNRGRVFSGNGFNDAFRDWCNEAELPTTCVFHGLRKAALTQLAEAGCSVHEIQAISGHKNLKEVEHYTRAVDQARLARAAMERIGNNGVKNDFAEVSKPLKGLPKKAG
jgi:integrase